ncbi:MAG: hypothetical protein C4523_09045 [Myxococcales bacterium]|nr:MAG: hypothetical protein C4523_09045 [Myxococcales bacterium]
MEDTIFTAHVWTRREAYWIPQALRYQQQMDGKHVLPFTSAEQTIWLYGTTTEPEAMIKTFTARVSILQAAYWIL